MTPLSSSVPPRKTRFARPALTFWTMGKIAAVGLFAFSRGAAAITFFGSDFYVLYHLLVPSAQGLGRTFTRFATSSREVWLTIDDGPDPIDTPRLLSLLAKHRARATFFVIGKIAADYPELLKQIQSEGHEVAHHSWSHPVGSFWFASRQRVARELDLTLGALKAANLIPRWFRAPVGIKSLFLEPALEARGMSNVGWSVRSLDSVGRDAKKISARVMAKVKPGAIILMHEGPRVYAAVRVDAIERVLTALAADGYRCVLPDPASLR